MRKWLMIFAVAVLGIMVLNSNAFSMRQAPKNIQVTGKVTEINLKALTVKITPKTGGAVVFQVKEKTKLTKGGKSITLPNLKKDDQATVTYKTSWGKKIALEIAVQERVVVPQKAAPTKSTR
jgi:hypothetical protein